MLDICIGSSSEYLKYTSVVIFSIVKSTNINESFEQYQSNTKFISDIKEGYCFHIFTEKENEDTTKLRKLVNYLNNLYPCKIQFHTMNNEEFGKFSYPVWCQNPAMFYKIKAPEVLKNLDICLFLGVDLICVGDIRELFAHTLEDDLIGAALDCCNYDDFQRKAKSKYENKADLVFSQNKYYINNEVMLINLKKWREEKIIEKCKYYLENYHLEGFVDVFPLVCAPNIKIISNRYNLILGVFTRKLLGLENTFSDESSTPIWNFSRVELEDIMSNLKIVHFCHYVYKPWLSPYNNHYVYKNMSLDLNCYPIFYPYYKDWWDLALSVPFFYKDFELLQKEIQTNALSNYANSLAVRLGQMRNEIAKCQNTLQQYNEKQENTNRDILKYINNIQNNITEIQNIYSEKNTNTHDEFLYKLGVFVISKRKNIIIIVFLPIIIFFMEIIFEYFKKDNSDLHFQVNNTFAYNLGKIVLNANKTWYKGGYFRLFFEIRRLKQKYQVKDKQQ